MSKIQDKNLRKEFEQLQEQQRKKLEKRKQKQAEKEKSQVDQTSLIASTAFGIEDDLGLKLSERVERNTDIYNEELVDKLNDDIRELKDESGRLYKLLSECDLELRTLRRKFEEQQVALSGPAGSAPNEAASTKIVELSKKIRDLNTQLNAEKSRSKQAQSRCLELEQELANCDVREVRDVRKSTAMSRTADLEPSVQDLKTQQDKVRQLELRMAETRNQCESLKKDLKMAHKVLAQEVGENFNISQLLNNSNSGGWKGRSTQIISLQKKINELKAELSDRNGQTQDRRGATTAGSDLGDDLEAEFMGSATAKRMTSQDDRRKDDIRRIERERKEMNERMARDLKALEADHEGMKNKFEASKARNKVLTNELKAVKDQMKTLVDKGKHDNELIEALFKQQENYKKMVENSSKKAKEVDREKEAADEVLKRQRDNNVIDQLKVIVAEREAKVRELEQELRDAKLKSVQEHQSRELEVMFNSARSQPIISSPTSAPDQSRPATGNTSRPVSKQASAREAEVLTDRSKVTSARRGKAGDEDQRLQLMEAQSLMQAAQVERDKLQELVAVMHQRAAEGSETVIALQGELQAEKRRCVQLEKQLGRAKLDQSAKGKKKAKSDVGESQPDVEGDIDDLQTRLMIQRDENEALKTALQSTLAAKEEDIRLYLDMVSETKRIFMEGLRQYRGGSS